MKTTAIALSIAALVMTSPAIAQEDTQAPAEETKREISLEPRLIEHIVRPNEQLHLLAGYYLLDARRWPEIRAWNPDKVTNPNIIHPGQVLKVWVAPEWEPPYDLDAYLVEYRQSRR